MAFYSHNPSVQLYAGEGNIKIEKKWKEYIKNPALIETMFENLAKANVRLEESYRKEREEVKRLQAYNNKLFETLTKERKEREQNEQNLQLEINQKENFVDNYSKTISDLKDYHEKIFNALSRWPGTIINSIPEIRNFLHVHDKVITHLIDYKGRRYVIEEKAQEQRVFPEGGTYKDTQIKVKDFVDTSTITPLAYKFTIDIDGTVEEFPHKKVPNYYTLQEMYGEVKKLKDGDKAWFDDLKIDDFNVIKTYLTIDGKHESLKQLREERDALRDFFDKASHELKNNTAIGMLNILTNFSTIKKNHDDLVLEIGNITDITKNTIEEMDKYLGDKRIRINKGALSASEKPKVERWLVDIYDAWKWTRDPNNAW